MQALFYGIGSVVIAIIAVAAFRLARGTNKRDPLLWSIFAVLFVATVWSGAELAVLFIISGLVALGARAWPGVRKGLPLLLIGLAFSLLVGLSEAMLAKAGGGDGDGNVLVQILVGRHNPDRHGLTAPPAPVTLPRGERSGEWRGTWNY